MNVQEQVNRLESLLSRVKENAIALRRERGMAALDATSATAGATESLEAEVPAGYQSRVKTLPPPASRPLTEPPMVAVSRSTSPTELQEPAQPEDTREHTKPLWLGVDAPTAQGSGTTAKLSGSLSSLPPESVTATEGSYSVASVSRGGGAPTDDFSTAESDALESSPPLSGERASSRSPLTGSVPASPEVPVSLEEPLRSAPIGAMAPDSFSDADQSFDISTAELEEPAEFEEDRQSRISDAPESALGATISLPPDEAENVELELAEPPPSSLRLMAPSPDSLPAEDELEVELPRTSYRAAYDDNLSAPPKALEELAAHDQNVQQRFSSKPVPSARSAQPRSLAPEPSIPPPDDDLPAVFSTRPEPSKSAPAPMPSAAPASHGEAAPAARGLTFEPGAQRTAAVFQGAFAAASHSFLKLLDESLALNVEQ